MKWTIFLLKNLGLKLTRKLEKYWSLAKTDEGELVRICNQLKKIWVGIEISQEPLRI